MGPRGEGCLGLLRALPLMLTRKGGSAVAVAKAAEAKAVLRLWETLRRRRCTATRHSYSSSHRGDSGRNHCQGGKKRGALTARLGLRDQGRLLHVVWGITPNHQLKMFTLLVIMMQ